MAPANLFDELYAVTGEYNEGMYSPLVNNGTETTSQVIEAGGNRDVHANHMNPPVDNSQPRIGDYQAACPKPPNPSKFDPGDAISGPVGTSHRLGWTTGLRTVRHLHQLFAGETLLVPSMGAHPVEGPVGYSANGDRVVYGAKVILGGETMPDNREVTALLASNYGQELSGVSGVNPNYV